MKLYVGCRFEGGSHVSDGDLGFVDAVVNDVPAIGDDDNDLVIPETQQYSTD